LQKQRALSLPVAGLAAFFAKPAKPHGRRSFFQQADGGHRVLRPAGRLRLLAPFAKCAADQTGVTAIEYALIAGVILIAVTALIDGIGKSVSGMLGSIPGHL
jgi:Flp pilus assembly pilin Flp